jgi:hypothetical protein
MSVARTEFAERGQGRRLAERLLGVLPSLETLAAQRHATKPLNPARLPGVTELAERPELDTALRIVHARVKRRDWLERIVPSLPDQLVPVPGRVTRGAQLEAAGFADRDNPSVGVDLACWNTPPRRALDDSGWRRVFTWVVASDRELCHVAIVSAPRCHRDSVSASYGYEAEGVPGLGVLRVTALADGRWRIIDCWGDASDADRVHQLAAHFAELPEVQGDLDGCAVDAAG